MYKNKERQKEASKQAVKRYRDSKKGITSGITSQGITSGITDRVLQTTTQRPANYGQPDCECGMCRANRNNGTHNIINHGDWLPANQLSRSMINRVPLPGDVDYET